MSVTVAAVRITTLQRRQIRTLPRDYRSYYAQTPNHQFEFVLVQPFVGRVRLEDWWGFLLEDES